MLKALILSEWNSKHLIKNAKQSLEWRRSKVLELSSEGRSQSDISRILQVSPATINTEHGAPSGIASGLDLYRFRRQFD